MAHKYPEYQIVWRFATDHNPTGWEEIGRPTKDLATLVDILGPMDYSPGQEWEDEGKIFKIRERQVHVSDWHDVRKLN